MGDLLRDRIAPYGASDDEKAEEENEEEDEESEEGGKGRMLGFMFGNVDDAGDLDEEYLDQDAKEHLSALADQLGPSLVDLELSTKRKAKETFEQHGEEQEDYAKKAENAVDYEDIQEQYEGPEVQVPVQDEQFYAQAALAVPHRKPGSFVPEEDNYDEEDEDDENGKGEDLAAEPTSVLASEVPVILPVAKEEPVGEVANDADIKDVVDEAIIESDPSQEELAKTKLHQQEAIRIELPVLCEEDGKEVLRFSELFGVREPYWVLGGRKGRQKRHLSREKFEQAEVDEGALEEDDEAVFKSCSYRLSVDALSNFNIDEDEDSDVEEEDEEGISIREDELNSNHLLVRDRRVWTKGKTFESCPAQPMKNISDEWEEVVEWRESIPASNFVAIHQQEWEADILWDSLDSQEETRSGELQSLEKVSTEVDSDVEQGMTSSSGRENVIWENRIGGMSCGLSRDTYSQWSKPILVEPLCRGSEGSEGVLDAIVKRHPQMLRLESSLVAEAVINQEGKSELGTGELGNRLSKLNSTCNQRNRELASGSWLDNVVWDLESPRGHGQLERPKIIYDLQDGQMVFEVPNSKRGQLFRVHAAAVVLSATVGKDAGGEGCEIVMPAASSIARFNISNDKYYTNKKTQHQQKSHAKKRAVHGVKVMHSLPAIKLQTMKPKLTNKDLANFHRPKAVWYPHHNEVAAKEQGKLAVKGPMKVILKTLGGKGSKLYVDASETVDVLKAKAAKKLGDLKASEKSKVLYSGKELEEGRTFAEQEVPPNSVLHLVRTKVYPWPKAQRLPGENKPIRPPGAFKKKSELSVKDGHVALMEYCEERPLLLSNVGMGARLYTYYRKLTPTDSTAANLRNERGSWVGAPVPLEPTEDSPFLGDIRPGDTVSSFETSMSRSPAFGHKVAHTDFLLVRSAKGKLSLRRIDSLHVIGQQEPHLEVLTPTSKTVQHYIGMRLLVYVYREFRNNEKPSSIPRVRADELTSQFPSLTEGFIRKRLKHCADLQKASGGEMWWVMRRNFRIPSEEELRRMVTPEMVCTYESMQAGLHHLKRMGVQKLTQPSGLSAAMNMLPDEAITLAAASHIERELQITPWNLSSNFVSATLQGRGSLERLEITGAGDPSGRGLGFSYLRVATKPPNVGAIVEKKAAVARGGGAVTGTDADLRRLSMDAAREVLLKFKVSETQIDKLTRWHRIALVRKLSSEQAASLGKVGVAALNKFARGQRMSFLQLQQQTREKCQEIWDRQVQSLAAAEGEDSESDGEANGDLDSFAGDLENLLEAEEGEDGDERKGKREGMRGLGARRRALQAQKEEEMEDEEAEAAELRRMLLEDDEAEEEQKKKKSGNASKEKKVVQVQEQNGALPSGSTSGAKKKKRILKRIIRTRKPDGTYTSREVIITDPKEVAAYLAKKSSLKPMGSKPAGDKVVGTKKGAAKPKKEKKVPVAKDVTKPKVVAKKVTKEGGSKEKPGRDGLRVVCGACGQLGHMRTNKKCPLYMEDGEGSLPRQDSAAAEGLLERQGTKITIKKKKIDELQQSKPSKPPKLAINKPVDPSGPPTTPSGPPVKGPAPAVKVKVSAAAVKVKVPAPAVKVKVSAPTVKVSAPTVKVKVPAPPAKIPALKLKIQPVTNYLDVGLGSNGSKVEGSGVPVLASEGGSSRPVSVESDQRFAEGNTPVPPFKGSKLRTQKKHKKKKLKEKVPLKQLPYTSSELYDQENADGMEIDFETQRDGKEMERARIDREREADMERQRLEWEREKTKQLREQRKKERQLEKQREREIERKLELEREAMERELQEKMEREAREKEQQERLKELKDKKRQREQENRRLRAEEQERAERVERAIREEAERQRVKEEMERMRIEKEKAEERAEKERLQREKEKQKRLREKAIREEREKNEKERLERERLENVRLENERVLKEKLEKERIAKEKQLKEEKLREQKRQTIKPKVREKQPLPTPESRVAPRDMMKDSKADKKDKGRITKKRTRLDVGNGPERPSDPPKRQRTRGCGEVELANTFETIVNILVKAGVSYLFLKPVSKKEAPDYLNFVKKPMDLGTIREKARKMRYKCRDDFRMDVEQIALNAHEYNDGRNPDIPPLADALLDLCDEELRYRKVELEEAEEAVERYEDDHPYTPNGRSSPPLDRRRKSRAL